MNFLSINHPYPPLAQIPRSPWYQNCGDFGFTFLNWQLIKRSMIISGLVGSWIYFGISQQGNPIPSYLTPFLVSLLGGGLEKFKNRRKINFNNWTRTIDFHINQEENQVQIIDWQKKGRQEILRKTQIEKLKELDFFNLMQFNNPEVIKMIATSIRSENRVNHCNDIIIYQEKNQVRSHYVTEDNKYSGETRTAHQKMLGSLSILGTQQYIKKPFQKGLKPNGYQGQILCSDDLFVI